MTTQLSADAETIMRNLAEAYPREELDLDAVHRLAAAAIARLPAQQEPVAFLYQHREQARASVVLAPERWTSYGNYDEIPLVRANLTAPAAVDGVHHDDWYQLCNAFNELKAACDEMLPFVSKAFVATEGSGERFDALRRFMAALKKKREDAQRIGLKAQQKRKDGRRK